MNRLHSRFSLLAWLLAACIMLSACRDDTPDWQLSAVDSSAFPALQFQLVDESGENITEAALTTPANVLFFGYTHCPDICPATLARLHKVVNDLGADADKVHIWFVTLDPARDTPQRLQGYTRAFGSHISGLTGSREAIDALAQAYRVEYRINDDEGENYTVDHTGATYFFDHDRRLRVIATGSDTTAAMVHDLTLLLEP